MYLEVFQASIQKCPNVFKHIKTISEASKSTHLYPKVLKKPKSICIRCSTRLSKVRPWQFRRTLDTYNVFFPKMDAKYSFGWGALWLAQLNPVGAFLSYDPLEESNGVVVFNQGSSSSCFGVVFFCCGKGLELWS